MFGAIARSGRNVASRGTTRLARFGDLPPRSRRTLWLLVAAAIVVGAASYEMRTSALQAWIFSYWAKQASYSVEPGSNDDALYPESGPLDERLGYTRLAEFKARMESDGFATVEQARFSATLRRLVTLRLAPPFREPDGAGLVIRDATGAPLYDFTLRRPRFERYEDIPLPIVRALLHIEDRGLAAAETRANPVVDWSRLAGAGACYVGQLAGLPVRVEGGSTLATQMEKYRHAVGGRTGSPVDKLTQMASASLKVYRNGPDTSETRRQLVLDYVNSVPLAAAPGYGEVHGLGEGLRVWFGLELDDVRRLLAQPGESEDKAQAFKQSLALIYAVRAPSHFLRRDRQTLAARVDAYLRLLAADGVVDAALAEQALAVPLRFPELPPPPAPPPLGEGKAALASRSRLGQLLGLRELYAVDRLHIDAATTIDGGLQQATATLFAALADPAFVAAQGLKAKHLLGHGDPARVVYSLLLVEATPRGNLVRVHSDNYPGPFDVNDGMKLELGSTAKLRTLVHYLELVAALHAELSPASADDLARIEASATDPLTAWAARTLVRGGRPKLEAFLEQALAREYSASPYERFFTGGGLHRFRNYDPDDDGRTLSVAQATALSNNLVFVRLMRDLVRYHEARLDYDARAVLADDLLPERRTLLESLAAEESRAQLRAAWTRLHGLEPAAIVPALLGRHARSPRHLAIVHYAWHPGGAPEELPAWLQAQRVSADAADVARLAAAYGNPRLTLADYGWLAGVHPLDLWCAGKLAANPALTWDELLADSQSARDTAMAWLFKTRNRRAQDLRLRTRIERDAFARMTTHWRRLGFAFERMVPSYASAIGSSADRPAALADLMGVLVNDGMRRSTTLFEGVRLAPDTPYYAALRALQPPGEQVLPVAVARAVRDVLASVVREGTARRVGGAFLAADGRELVVGGKTGSGDNRRETGRDDQTPGESYNRTAAFTFYVGERHYGVITASVLGPEAADYEFTSSLPLAVLRLLAPAIAERAAAPERAGPLPPLGTTAPDRG